MGPRGHCIPCPPLPPWTRSLISTSPLPPMGGAWRWVRHNRVVVQVRQAIKATLGWGTPSTITLPLSDPKLKTMLCFASPPPPAPPHLATSTFLTPSGAMKRPSLQTLIVQGARSPSSPALTLSNSSQTTTCCTATSCCLQYPPVYYPDRHPYPRGSELRQFPALRLAPGPTFPIKFWAIIALPRYVPCTLIPVLLLPLVTPRLRRWTSSGSGQICLPPISPPL